MKKYYGKFLVIKDEKIEGVYDTENDAIDDMLSKKYKMGDFIVR